MKLFINIEETDEIVFIPSFLLVDNFEKLLRKKDRKFKRAMLNYMIEFLLVDKNNVSEGFNIDFSQIEDKSIDNFNKRNIIDGKSIHFHDQGISYAKCSLPKEEFTEIYKQHTKVKEKSGVITFEHIFKHDLARNTFFQMFHIDFDKSIRKEKNKNIERHLIKSALFYLQFYENVLKDAKWFKNYKRKDVVITWISENIANLIIHKKENIENYDSEILLEIFKSYFSLQHDNFPVFNLEDVKRELKKRNTYASLSKEEKKMETLHLEKHFKTNIGEHGLEVLKLFMQLLNNSYSVEKENIIKNFFIKTLKSNLSEETEFVEEAQFLFNQEKSIEYLTSNPEIFSSKNLVYLESRVENKQFLVDFYFVLKDQEEVNLETLLPIIGIASPQLTKAIIEDNWLNVIKLVTQKFSEKSHTYERILNEVIQRIPFDDLYKSVFNKKTKNLDMATKLFQFYKKQSTKSDYQSASEKIIREFNFTNFDKSKRKYFETLDSDVVTDYILSMNSDKLQECSGSEGLFNNILQIENKHSIPKLLASLQKVDINIFNTLPEIVNSKYFWTAFEHNLQNEEFVTKNISLTSTNYFNEFLLKAEGVSWLKSKVGQFWLSLSESELWKKSEEGIFIQKIVLKNQIFFIDTEEVFNSYVEMLKSITRKNIDDTYLINNIPETFNFILKRSPESILLINFETFDRYQDLIKIINNDKERFLFAANKDIVLRSISILLNYDKAKIDKETSREIEHNFEYFYSNNLMWFTTESFVSYMKKYKSETIYKELFDKSIMGLSNETQEIVENLIKCNQKKYLKFLIKRKTIPFWITGNVEFINSLKISSPETAMVINLIGEQYFDTNFRNSALEHKDWFTEFANLFSFKNKKQLNEKFIYPRVQDCLSQKCGTKKSANNKEGFKDFKDVFYAVSFYSKKYLHVQRPYRCSYSPLWHKTSEWE